MDLATIYRKIEKEFNIKIIQKVSSNNLPIFSCCPIAAVSNMEYLEHCLYLTGDIRLMQVCRYANILMILPEESQLPQQLANNVSYSISSIPIIEINQFILLQLQRECQFMQTKEKCIHVLHSNAGYYELLKIAYEQLKKPIFLVDFSYKIIEHYPRNSVPDVLLKEKGSYYLNFEASTAQKDYLIDRIIQSNIPFILTTEQYQYRMLICTIRSRETPLAYICIPEINSIILEEDVEFAEILSQIISIELLKNTSYLLDVNSQERFLITLFNGVITSKQMAENRLQLLELKYETYKWICQIPLYEALHKNRVLAHINFLSRIFPLQVIFSHKNMIICFVSRKENIFLATEAFEHLSAYLKAHKLKMAVSNTFLQLEDSALYYQQTLSLLSHSHFLHNDCSIIMPTDNYLGYILTQIPSKSYLKEFIHPDIKTFSVSDEKYHTKYNLTLRVYLQCGRNAQRAADKLKIRKSSFFYRIGKMKELVDFSLEDSNKMLAYEISFQIIDFLISNN